MRLNWNVIKFGVIAVLIAVLFSFSGRRNDARNLTELDVRFVDETPPFITLSTVNKLLIQNEDSVTSIGKDKVVLNEMERRLLENPMVRDAQVFVTVEGKLGARIEQRDPIARIAGSPHYYLDDEGKKMPLSEVHTARVPLVTGTSKTQFAELTPLLLRIRNDDFMRQMVVGLHRRADGEVELRLRKHDLKVLFGTPETIDLKFQNFKAFYQKTKEDNTLEGYTRVNLKFGNQVVATKK